ncbi:hypothetical protein AB1Y20_014815 [Prymnesium parvum]|uniref:ADP-ribosylation factor-like protein 2-binding protein n=1 Tax=Prymnesium parvum TaxID=97485 RepID=A0AB34JW13_PRYPA|mmetsp:Transcript_27533/g.66672  ORF Transcript_27533/g.66672 Transcript_27533/m.66672 type:complete len:217 (-) Transcript_27533:86-736(-)
MAASDKPKPAATANATQAAVVDVGGFDEIEDDVVDGNCDEGEEDSASEEVMVSSGENADQTSQILAELEDMMMDEEFNAKVDAFTQRHCDHFDEGEENKLIYTSLFAEYTKMLEEYIEERLGATLEGFDMQAFCATLSGRADKEELPLALEMLSAYGDFESFKAMMLSCKVGATLGDMGVVGAPVHVFTEEQEDGEAMPDLNLSISGLGNNGLGNN